MNEQETPQGEEERKRVPVPPDHPEPKVPVEDPTPPPPPVEDPTPPQPPMLA